MGSWRPIVTSNELFAEFKWNGRSWEDIDWESKYPSEEGEPSEIKIVSSIHCHKLIANVEPAEDETTTKSGDLGTSSKVAADNCELVHLICADGSSIPVHRAFILNVLKLSPEEEPNNSKPNSLNQVLWDAVNAPPGAGPVGVTLMDVKLAHLASVVSLMTRGEATGITRGDEEEVKDALVMMGMGHLLTKLAKVPSAMQNNGRGEREDATRLSEKNDDDDDVDDPPTNSDQRVVTEEGKHPAGAHPFGLLQSKSTTVSLPPIVIKSEKLDVVDDGFDNNDGGNEGVETGDFWNNTIPMERSDADAPPVSKRVRRASASMSPVLTKLTNMKRCPKSPLDDRDSNTDDVDNNNVSRRDSSKEGKREAELATGFIIPEKTSQEESISLYSIQQQPVSDEASTEAKDLTWKRNDHYHIIGRDRDSGFQEPSSVATPPTNFQRVSPTSTSGRHGRNESTRRQEENTLTISIVRTTGQPESEEVERRYDEISDSQNERNCNELETLLGGYYSLSESREEQEEINSYCKWREGEEEEEEISRKANPSSVEPPTTTSFGSLVSSNNVPTKVSIGELDASQIKRRHLEVPSFQSDQIPPTTQEEITKTSSWNMALNSSSGGPPSNADEADIITEEIMSSSDEELESLARKQDDEEEQHCKKFSGLNGYRQNSVVAMLSSGTLGIGASSSVGSLSTWDCRRVSVVVAQRNVVQRREDASQSTSAQSKSGSPRTGSKSGYKSRPFLNVPSCKGSIPSERRRLAPPFQKSISPRKSNPSFWKSPRVAHPQQPRPVCGQHSRHGPQSARINASQEAVGRRGPWAAPLGISDRNQPGGGRSNVFTNKSKHNSSRASPPSPSSTPGHDRRTRIEGASNVSSAGGASRKRRPFMAWET